MFKNKIYLVVYLQIVLVLVLASCGGKDKEKDPRTVFKYNEAMGGISSLDPAASSNFENIWAVNQLFNGLVQMDDSLKVLPCIAKSWEISEDGLVYTFHLRNDVFFHNCDVFPNSKGRKVVAKDFVYSFNRLYDTKVSSASTLLYNVDKQNKNTNNGFVAVNDTTFVIYLKEPFSPFLGILTMKYFSVVPQEAVDHYKEEFRRNAVGTGPFKLKFWEEGTSLVMHKNDNYFEFEGANRLPYLDAVAVSFIKEKETAFMQFLSGEIDMLSGIDAFNPSEVLDADGKLKPLYKGKFSLETQPYIKTDYIGILIDENINIVKSSPLKQKAIRKAINYAFDREKLIKFFHNNLGVPATSGFIPAGLPSYSQTKVKGYHYNPEKVNQLLEEAGYPGGKGLPEITLHTTENYIEIVEFIQGQLSENHITMKISIENATVLKTNVAKNEFNMFKKSWVGDYADEENFMSLFYSKNFSPEGSNYTHYKNPDFDKLFERARRENNDSIKTALYQQMDQMVMDDAPVIPLYYDQVVRLVKPNIKNLTANPINLLNLKAVKKVNE
ncbi:MAG: ABC transporter substrate-binding protein [Bacteroidota bacterium]|nr:ABC transporter substrate-binding protein [Bacteroidota bacterium]